jgi:hypothetical protein
MKAIIYLIQFYTVSVRSFVIHFITIPVPEPALITVPIPLTSEIKSRFRFHYGKKLHILWFRFHYGKKLRILRFRFRNTVLVPYTRQHGTHYQPYLPAKEINQPHGNFPDS